MGRFTEEDQVSNSDFEDAPALSPGERVLVTGQPPNGPVKDGVYVIGEAGPTPDTDLAGELEAARTGGARRSAFVALPASPRPTKRAPRPSPLLRMMMQKAGVK